MKYVLDSNIAIKWVLQSQICDGCPPSGRILVGRMTFIRRTFSPMEIAHAWHAPNDAA